MWKWILSLWLLLTGAVMLHAQEERQDTLMLMSYNLLNFEQTPSNTRPVYFRTVIDSLKPDVLLVQELIELSGAQFFLDSVMLAVDTQYALAPFISSFDTDRGLYYKKNKYICDSASAIDTELRDIQHYWLRHLESNTSFQLFTLHLKASSNEDAQRAREVDSLLKVTALIPDSIPFIVAGDFNIYDENEPAYLALTDAGSAGTFIDPLRDSLTTFWNNSDNSRFHTQSTRTTSFGGGSTGGLDDRFDLILYSSAVGEGYPLSYLEGSTVPFGNDGLHHNQAINQMPNLAVTEEMANALHQASDHLPIFASFIFHYTLDTGVIDTGIMSVDQESAKQWKVYPVPAHDVLHLEFDELPEYLQLIDICGNVVWESRSFHSLTNLPVHHFKPGYYMLQAMWEDQRQYRQILIVP